MQHYRTHYAVHYAVPINALGGGDNNLDFVMRSPMAHALRNFDPRALYKSKRRNALLLLTLGAHAQRGLR